MIEIKSRLTIITTINMKHEELDDKLTVLAFMSVYRGHHDKRYKRINLDDDQYSIFLRRKYVALDFINSLLEITNLKCLLYLAQRLDDFIINHTEAPICKDAVKIAMAKDNKRDKDFQALYSQQLNPDKRTATQKTAYDYHLILSIDKYFSSELKNNYNKSQYRKILLQFFNLFGLVSYYDDMDINRKFHEMKKNSRCHISQYNHGVKYPLYGASTNLL